MERAKQMNVLLVGNYRQGKSKRELFVFVLLEYCFCVFAEVNRQAVVGLWVVIWIFSFNVGSLDIIFVF